MDARNKPRWGRTKKAIWDFIQEHFPKQYFSPADLRKAGLREAFYGQFRSRIANLFIEEGLLAKKGRGRYKILPKLIPVEEFGKRMKPEAEAFKVRLQAKMEESSNKIVDIEKDIENCAESIIKAQKEKVKLERKKEDMEKEMEKLKKILDLLKICPEIAEITEDIKELDI